MSGVMPDDCGPTNAARRNRPQAIVGRARLTAGRVTPVPRGTADRDGAMRGPRDAVDGVRRTGQLQNPDQCLGESRRTGTLKSQADGSASEMIGRESRRPPTAGLFSKFQFVGVGLDSLKSWAPWLNETNAVRVAKTCCGCGADHAWASHGV